MRRTLAPLTLSFVALALLPAPPVHARDGILDAGFGNHVPGISVIDIVSDPVISIDLATAAAVQADGRLLLGGSTMHAHAAPVAISLVRLDRHGHRDQSFGAAGTRLLDAGSGVALREVFAVLPRTDGSVHVLARGWIPNDDVMLLCRVDADGTIVDACRQLPAPAGMAFRGAGMAAVLDGQGRIVTATSVGPTTFSYNVDVSIARWNADGSADTGFGSGGATTVTRFDELAGQSTRDLVAGLAIDAHGRIVVGASSQPRSASGDGISVFAATRLLANGALDTAFADGGARRIPSTSAVGASGLALAVDGAVILAGTTTIGGSAPAYAECLVARLDTGGAIDAGFGDAGLLRLAFHPGTTLDSECSALVVQPDGRLVVAGHARAPDAARGFDFAIARLWPDGRLDRGFGVGGDGRSLTPIDLNPTFGNHDTLAAIVWHEQGLVAVGSARSGYNLDEFVAVRLRADGLLDDGFEQPVAESRP